MTRSGWMRTGLVAAGCAAVGAVAGIAGGAAAPSGKSPQPRAFGFRMAGGAGPGAMLRGGPPVHAELVVPKRSGGGFETVTEDNGKLKSRDGDTLTITDGTDSQTYKDVTVTVPSGATIMRNGNKASLDDLKTDDFVHVSQSGEGTFVFAHDASFKPRFIEHGRHIGPGRPPGGPPPPFAP